MILRKNIIDYGNPVNRSAPLNRGLVGWWKAFPDRLSGNVFYELTGTPNHASLVGTPLWDATAGKPGILGGLKFNGSSNYANPTTAFAFGTGNFAISFWINFTTTSQGIPIGMVSLATSAILRIWINTDAGTGALTGAIAAQIRSNGGGLRGADIRPSANDGKWHHVVVTRDSDTTTSIYFDGTAPSMTLGTNALTGALDCQYAMPFGAENLRTAIGNYANCTMDDIRIYNRELTLAESSVLYSAARCGYVNELNRISRPIGVKAAAAAAASGRLFGAGNYTVGA